MIVDLFIGAGSIEIEAFKKVVRSSNLLKILNGDYCYLSIFDERRSILTELHNHKNNFWGCGSLFNKLAEINSKIKMFLTIFLLSLFACFDICIKSILSMLVSFKDTVSNTSFLLLTNILFSSIKHHTSINI